MHSLPVRWTFSWRAVLLLNESEAKWLDLTEAWEILQTGEARREYSKRLGQSIETKSQLFVRNKWAL